MRVRLEPGADGGLLVAHVPREERERLVREQKQRTALGSSGGGDALHAHQFMLCLDTQLWREMCAAVAPGDALMPHRPPHGGSDGGGAP